VLFDKLTSDVDELNEIAKGKIEYSILMGVIIICIAILVNPALSSILQAMIPYPDVVRFN
jgi:ABC-type tungstate transport system substrate-binding protein